MVSKSGIFLKIFKYVPHIGKKWFFVVCFLLQCIVPGGGIHLIETCGFRLFDWMLPNGFGTTKYATKGGTNYRPCHKGKRRELLTRAAPLW